MLGASKGNRLTSLGAAIVLILLVIAVFAPRLAPHDPASFNLSFTYSPPSHEFYLGTGLELTEIVDTRAS